MNRSGKSFGSQSASIGPKSAYEISVINSQLITEVSGIPESEFNEIIRLDLNLNDSQVGDDQATMSTRTIRKIENLILVPNLQCLSISHNAINRMKGFDRLTGLLELNLAENDIKNIENLHSLRSLLKLNLSGNKIERIPASITQLKRLARNELHVLSDLAHLHSFSQLSDLIADENPFCDSQRYSYRLYTVAQVDSLTTLDREAVTRQEHIKARKYVTDRTNELSAAEVGRPTERPLLRASDYMDSDSRHLPSSPPEPQAHTEHPYSSVQRLTGAVSSPVAPAVTFTLLKNSSSATSSLPASASKLLTDLQGRVETLTKKLLAAEGDKKEMKAQLDAFEAESNKL